MAKGAKVQGMNHRKNRKARAATAIEPTGGEKPTRPDYPVDQMTTTNRAVTASGNMNKHRGDRRDTNRVYTGNQKHRARGNTPRRDVSTRAR